MPSTTDIDSSACRGDSLVTDPSTTEFVAGGCGRTSEIDRVCNFINCHGKLRESEEFHEQNPGNLEHQPGWLLLGRPSHKYLVPAEGQGPGVKE